MFKLKRAIRFIFVLYDYSYFNIVQFMCYIIIFNSRQNTSKISCHLDKWGNL